VIVLTRRMGDLGKAEGGVAYYRTPRVVKTPSRARVVASRLMLPLLSLLSVEQSERLGLTPLDDERVLAALRHARGRLLDVGCGSNTLVRTYGDGLGVDVFPWEGIDLLVDTAAKLPLEDCSFDTVSYLACLNHIVDRQDALLEAYRVLRPGGTLIVTMLSPLVGRLVHRLRRRHDPDHSGRQSFGEAEAMGLSQSETLTLMRDAGFELQSKRSFVWRLNRIYVARKPG
jgi:SAM-dependent methyltransferase